MNKRDLVIIGGGAGGLVVASVAAQLGLAVTLIEKEKKLGGDCLHYGCVPSKALLKSAHVAHAMRQAKNFGFQEVIPETNMAAVNARVQDAIDTIQVHDSHERFESFGCEILTGQACFLDDHSIKVGDQTLSSKRFVIATGSVPVVPPIEGLNDSGYITNENIFNLKQLPEHLMIIGAGPIGIEMAQAFVRLGSRVTVIEMADRILSRLDVEASQVMATQLISEGVEIFTNTAVTQVETNGADKTVILSNDTRVTGDQLLVAIGRRAVVENLGLVVAGVEYTVKGVTVNTRMQTSKRHIYACGDVTGLYQFTHMAEQQAGVVIANAVFRIPKRIKYDIIPSVVFTEPECAQVGVLESEVKDDASVEVIKFDMSNLDRAVAEHTTAGFAKLIVKKGRLLGAHIVAPHAGDTIHELALAMQEKLKLSKITGMIHAYPSYAQINRRAASQYYTGRLFSKGTQRLVRWLNRIF